jgi:hypothetical protein
MGAMAQTCPRCFRANPTEALFCYHDGGPLAGAHGAAALARQRFPMPFVFPSGRACHSFDELALTCFDDWQTARDLLQQGVFVGFFAGLGRADLVQAAREAQRSPDRDVGLDDLLARLPTQARTPPRLVVEPTQVNLGVLHVGQDMRWDLRLLNQGMGLVQGSVSCESATWLGLGETGGQEKVFQFLHDFTIPVQVRGRELRAGAKPLEARLELASSGGKSTVVVRATVPVVPFPEGPLAGAVTPRQIAEKSKASPKEAARWFENGAVMRWYRDNGWAYPVEGPPASGLAAIQQFFEALGLTRPPKVEISETAIRLEGTSGERLHHTLRVVSPERRPVFAHAISDQPWLSVNGVDLEGRSAAVYLVVPSVPHAPGSVLHARLTVTGNGRQRFVVPVTLEVSGAPRVIPYGAAMSLPEAGRAVVVVPPAPLPEVEVLPAEVIEPLPLPEVLPVEEDVPYIEEVAPLPELLPVEDDYEERRRPVRAQAGPGCAGCLILPVVLLALALLARNGSALLALEHLDPAPRPGAVEVGRARLVAVDVTLGERIALERVDEATVEAAETIVARGVPGFGANFGVDGEGPLAGDPAIGVVEGHLVAGEHHPCGVVGNGRALKRAGDDVPVALKQLEVVPGRIGPGRPGQGGGSEGQRHEDDQEQERGLAHGAPP